MTESPSRVATPTVAAMVLLAVAAYGVWALLEVSSAGLGAPLRPSMNVFFRLFALNEPLSVGLLVAFAAAVLFLRAAPGEAAAWPVLTPGRTWVVAGLVAVAAQLGHIFAVHGVALSMDEFNADFQATILSHGQVFAPVTEPWRGFIFAIKPVFVVWRAGDLTWYSGYVPVYAAMRAVAQWVHASALLNPVLAGTSVLLLGAIARRLWPAEPRRVWVAVACFALSAQFVVTSMTTYAMPAHLAANLLWLYLYVRDDRAGMIGAALVGAVALGLHNPFPHALFVAPFLLRMLLRRRFGQLAWTLVVYAVASYVWLRWLQMNPTPGGGTGLLSLFRVPGLDMWELQGMNLVLALGWQTPVAALLVVMAMLGHRRLTATEQDLALGIGLSFLFYVLFNSTQGHGWGYRYIYAVLGNVALLAAAALPMLEERVGAVRARRLVSVGLLLGVVALVMRVQQVERFVRPFASAVDRVSHADADVVVVRTSEVWYGRDLIRNDPYLRGGPVVVNAGMLGQADYDRLKASHGPRLRFIDTDELVALGMLRVPPRGPYGPPPIVP